MIELLAPAQNKRCAISAINYGADAVYIGAATFGARKKVGNSLEDIAEIVEYAHKFYAKVYVTVNTILTDGELIEAKKLIYALHEIGVDAIIIQDMGILELELPPIAIFASTQCDNRTLEKVKFFEKIGLNRVILARELSLKQIEEICKNTTIEIETFIHGALCVSYSGQCYMSFANGGRSANRGECAQPCRKKYSLIDENGLYIAKDKYLLSLKDFNASNHIERLIEIGVTSFKIEGRLKDENYVKNVVAYYRKLIDKFAQKTSSGFVEFDFEPNLKKSFNRSFTDYFLEKRNEIFNFASPKSLGGEVGRVLQVYKDYFEYDGKILSAQDGLCYFKNDDLKGFLVNKIVGKKVYPNRMDNIEKNMKLYRNFDAKFEKILQNSKTKRRIKVNFTLDSTTLTAIDEDKNEISIALKVAEIAQNQIKIKENFEKQLKKAGDSDFYIDNVKIVSENLPFVTISAINELRRSIFEKLMEERLKNYKKTAPAKIEYNKYPENKLHYNSNVHNEASQQFYEKCEAVVCEKSIESSKECAQKKLMITKHCLKFAFNLCKDKRKLFLADEKGKKYPLTFDCNACEMSIYNNLTKN